jgi:uncharacterized protein YjcR
LGTTRTLTTIKPILEQNFMDTETLLWKLKLKLDVSSDEELADMVGVSIARIKSWYKREELTESIVADLIIKAVDKGGEILLKIV